jgi:hypothetical protein
MIYKLLFLVIDVVVLIKVLLFVQQAVKNLIINNVLLHEMGINLLVEIVYQEQEEYHIQQLLDDNLILVLIIVNF